MGAAQRIEILPAALVPASVSALHLFASGIAQQGGDFRLAFRRGMDGQQDSGAASFSGLGAGRFESAPATRAAKRIHGAGQRADISAYGHAAHDGQGGMSEQ